MANGTEKLAVLQKVRLLILGGMQVLDPDGTQDGMDEDFFNKENIDTVFIFGATNDSWLETTPKGEVIFEGWREEDLYSTLPAIAYMIAKLKEAIPGGNIVFIINTELEDCITKGVKEASEHFGTSYIELSDIDKSEGHPTVLGMMQIAGQIREAVKN